MAAPPNAIDRPVPAGARRAANPPWGHACTPPPPRTPGSAAKVAVLGASVLAGAVVLLRAGPPLSQAA
jgi:hypothetical protein